MADFDDERPDFDAAFRDEPEDDPRSRRRRTRSGRRAAADEAAEAAGPGDSEGTGEVPRSRLRGGGSGRSRRGSSGSRPSRPRTRAGRGGSRGGASGGAAVLQQPRARLALGIAFAVVLVIVIALVVKDCQRSQLEDSYTSYVNEVAQVQTASAEQGAALRAVMDNPRGDKPPQLRQKISAIAKDAQALVDRADGLDPPGSLSSPQRSLVLALEYRVTGLEALAQNLPALLQSTDQQRTAAGIANVMELFLASDVLYKTSFLRPAQSALEDDDITGVEVPPLAAFLPNTTLVSASSPDGARSLLPDLRRRTAQAAGGDQDGAGASNLRGTSLESTVALPSDTPLETDSAATVQTSDLLKWAVTVKNGGDYDETNVIVRASFSYSDSPNDVDVREVPIESIASGATVTVEIPGPSTDKVVFGDQGTLAIEVEPVTGETRVDNNTVEYPVKITI